MAVVVGMMVQYKVSANRVLAGVIVGNIATQPGSNRPTADIMVFDPGAGTPSVIRNMPQDETATTVGTFRMVPS